MTSSSAPSRESICEPRTIHIALAGNPNVGKTTLFNRLTGAKQRVGNYPGVTVEKKAGTMTLVGETVTVIDLPGTYSLAAASADERVVIDVLTGHVKGTPAPDVVVCVVDATNLMRNVFLASQIADIGIPVVIALNMYDAAQEQGVAVDPELLAERLGVPVIPLVATKGRGVDELKRAIQSVIGTEAGIAPMPWPPCVEDGLQRLGAAIRADAGSSLSRVELLRVLFDIDTAIPARVGWKTERAQPVIDEARQLLTESGLNPVSAEAILRYGRLSELLDGIFHHESPSVRGAAGESTQHGSQSRGTRTISTTESIDRLLTHRVWGLVIFAAMMWIVFQSLYWFAGFFMDGIDFIFSALADWVGSLLTSMPMLQSLAVDGVIAGVGGVVIFLPQILILFFFIALLEDTGYMSRAAFLMDKLFSWCGLNGRSFVPMLSSYACAIPGVMATRTIDDPKARLVTILISPLMSCSARLPVYVLLIGAFIEPRYGPFWAGLSLVAMHFVGLLTAIPVAMFLNRFIIRGKRIPFVMEMPPYRPPQLRNVFWRMWQSGQKFLRRAGTVIFAMTIIIWALSYFPRPDSVAQQTTAQYCSDLAQERNISEEGVGALLDDPDSPEAQRLEGRIAGAYLEQSYMGRIGKAIQPIFAPAGFDWKTTVGVVASFPAREVIIATLGIIYNNLGGDVDEESDDLISAMQRARWEEGPRAGEPVFTPLVAFSIMIFFALCMQCGSTVAVIAREANWGWAVFAFGYMTALAWIGAVLVYQIGSLIF